MSQSISERVAESVRVEAARRSISQTKIAEALGTSQQSVSRRMLGKTSFDVEEIYSLASAFGMTVSALLPDADIVALAAPSSGGDVVSSPKRAASPSPL